MPSHLQLFLDTAEVAEWRAWMPTGLFYGVTTNPLLLERAGVACTVETLQTLTQTALDLGAHEIHLQTWGTTVETLVARATQLAAIAPQVVVKVPITRMGVEAAARMRALGLRTTLTGVYAIHQALVAAALDVEYAAPYLGRINDQGRSGRDDITAMQRAIAGVHSSMRLLVASIRQIDDLTLLAAEGLDTFTISPAIAAALFDVPATLKAATDFEQAALRMSPQ